MLSASTRVCGTTEVDGLSQMEMRRCSVVLGAGILCLLMLVVGGGWRHQEARAAQEEGFFRSVRPLTEGCIDAEAYFSWNGKYVVFQRKCKRLGIACDQIFWFALDSPEVLHPVSPGKGKTTCSFFVPGDSLIVFASTHAYMDSCPPKPDRRKIGQYVWALYPEFEIFLATRDGRILRQLTRNRVYDAEVVVSPSGRRLLFTSMRDGDLELYLMNLDGSGVKRLTYREGYDGGAFFSPSGRWIVFRSSVFESEEERRRYRELLRQNLVAPAKMEIFIMDTNGQNLRQITHLGGANWAPYFHPSEEWIIFSSNWEAVREGKYFPFHLYMVSIEDGRVIRVTSQGTFNAFPMFSGDGRWLLFSSTRGGGEGMGPIRVFLAEWDEEAFQRFVGGG